MVCFNPEGAERYAAVRDRMFAQLPGTFRQTAELTKTQRDLLAKLKIAHPKKIIEATPASP